jgi:hypothetical protein
LLPVLAFVASLLFLFIAYYVPLEGFANLGYIVMAMMGIGVFIISIIAALIFDFNKRRKTKT